MWVGDAQRGNTVLLSELQRMAHGSRVVALPVCPDADFEMQGCGLNAQMTFTDSDLLILSQVNAWPSLEVGGFPPGSPCCGV